VPEAFRILFVHNVPAVRDLASEALQREFPQATFTAVDGPDLLERALTSNGYDVTVTDYSLRWGDGPAVFQTIKSRWPECPVIVFSVSGEDEEILRTMGEGAGPESGWPQFLTLLIVAVRAASEKVARERDRRAANERLRESEARFRSVFESATDAIVLADPEGRIISWNRAARAIFGYLEDEVLGRPLTILMPPRYRGRHEAGMIRVREGGASRVVGRTLEMYGLRKDGAEFPIELAIGTWDTERGHFFSGVIRDITRRKEDEERLRRSNDQLRELSTRIEAVQEVERTSIARKLHDELGQALTAIRLDVAWIERRLQEKRLDREACLARIGRMGDTIETTIAGIRRISAELRPGVLDELGLTPALDWQAREFTDRTGIACRFCSTLGEPVPPDVATAMFRIVQECLTNVARHAGARGVEVKLAGTDGAFVLVVSDDGRGIEETEIASVHSLGILGMLERCRALGGELSVEGRAGKGTVVTVRIPHASEISGKAAPQEENPAGGALPRAAAT
jgi:PAS domain S-box-containing protein